MSESGRSQFCSTFQKWFEKASLADVAGKCELLWTDENPLYDTVIKVLNNNGQTEQEFRAHRLILAMGSRKLASKLYGPTGNATMAAADPCHTIEINFLCNSAVKLVLEFLYTNNIKENLDWALVGGLYYAAKELEIPGLTELCERVIEKERLCENILVMFQQILTIKELKWPKQYYNELLSLCYFYILRNGEKILRSEKFVELTSEQVDSVISSDFLIVAEELTVYNALKRWARHRCQKLGIDSKSIPNHLQVLGVTSDNDLGLLKHVRYHELDTNMDIFKSKKSLVPDVVYKSQLLDEHNGIFSEKKRYADINSGTITDFRKHIELLTKSLSSPAFSKSSSRGKNTTKPRDNFTPTSMGEVKQEILSSPSASGNSQMKTEQPLVKIEKEEKEPAPGTSQSCSKTRDWGPSTSSANVTSVNAVNIKVEAMSDEEPEAPCNDFPTISSQYSKQPQPQTPQHFGKPPLRSINGNVSPTKRKGKNSTMMKDQKIKSRKVEIPKSQSSSPALTSRRKTGLNVDDMVQNECFSSENMNIYSRAHQKMKLLKIIEDCDNRPNLQKIVLEDIHLEGLANKKFPSICLPNVTDFVLKAQIENPRKEVFEKLKATNLEDLIFFYNETDSLQARLSDLWSCNEITVTIEEITIVRVRDLSLTLNHLKNLSFYSLNTQMLSNIRTLNLGNCIMQNQNWLQQNYARGLLNLRLIHVNGLKTASILRQCSALETLSLWPMKNQIPTLSLDDLEHDSLVSLSIHSHVIKISATNKRFFKNMQKMYLKDCSWDPNFIEKIPKLFPNLNKLFVISRFNQPGPELLKVARSIHSIQEFGVWNFDVSSLNKVEYKEEKTFLSSLKLKRLTGELNFVITRGKRDDKWTGVNITNKNLPEQIYASFGFIHFYSYDAWKRHFWANYDCY